MKIYITKKEIVEKFNLPQDCEIEIENLIIKGSDNKELEWKEVEEKMTWNEAMEYAKGLGEDWRLPTIEECKTHKGFAPDRHYWSSTENVGDRDYVCYWNTYYGYVGYYYKYAKLSVRCVR